MTAPLRVGVVGCGIIAHRYVDDAPAFDTFRPVACADLDEACAAAFAERHGLGAHSVDELIADDELDVVLNLTPPAAHYRVLSAALEAGKHVYTEKPLTTTLDAGRALLAEAAERGLRVGCAPDTFLGSAYQAAAAAIARGDIGEPLGASATMLVGGPDSWHPNADFFYRAGAGPMLDMGPYYLAAIAALLGPFAAATGFASTPTPERTFGVGPRAGERFAVDVPTHVAGALRLASGGLVTMTVSFEARAQYVSGLTVHGTEGRLELPDANAFGGEVRIARGRDAAVELAYESRGAMETRGLGLHEMIDAIRAGRPHRASGAFALHVLEAATAVVTAAGEGSPVAIGPVFEDAAMMVE